ncbi:SMC-Scp complex subunit ScpB [Candidatus Bathyarchaeota archaeon]|nr:SMC-Scp complex subunit ScpB [Candidatus Bathyarchaeota archaeon]
MSTTKDVRLAPLEAILYAIGKPISLTNICAHLKLADELEASNLIKKLAEIYEVDGSPLEIKFLAEERVVLQLKPDYSKQAKFSMKPPLTTGPLRTLSYIAYNQPVEKKEVADARGSQAYKHIKQLESMNLINSEKTGKDTILRTTDDFADYLGLSRDRSNMKRQLSRIFKKLEDDSKKKKK